MKTKSKLVVWSIVIKEEAKKCFVLFKKRYIEGEKHITPIDSVKHLRNQTFQGIAKFIMVDFYETDFKKAILQLVKVDEMCSILKSASLILQYRWHWNF